MSFHLAYSFVVVQKLLILIRSHFNAGQNGFYPSLQAINAGEGVEKREPSYTVGGNAN